jgi:hypothetical protein
MNLNSSKEFYYIIIRCPNVSATGKQQTKPPIESSQVAHLSPIGKYIAIIYTISIQGAQRSVLNFVKKRYEIVKKIRDCSFFSL